MAYQIDRFNGTFLVSIDDQTINTTATDLRLVGRNYAGYGEIQNENFLHLLENFSGTTAPPRSLTGQIWYDASTQRLKYFNGTRYKVASGAEVSATAPIGLSVGEFWFDSTEEQLYAWTGDEFVLVGPEKSPIYGDTAAIPQVVKDVLGENRSILRLVSGTETLAIVSKDEFTINQIINPISGFNLVKKGITLVNLNQNQTSSEHRFWGTASNSELFGGLPVSEFMRSNNSVFSSQVKFSDSGILIGDQDDLRISIINGNEPLIENRLGGDIIFRISSGNAINDVGIVETDGFYPGTTDLYNLGRSGTRWNRIHSKEVTAEVFYGKLVGSIETPPPAPGQVNPPLQLQSISITGNVNVQPPPTGTPPNFNVILADSTGVVNISSGVLGAIENLTVGLVNPQAARFTTVTTTNRLTVDANIESTSTTTGSMVVTGGVGISGNLNVGGNGLFLGTGAIIVPVGNTSQRPFNPVIGMIRFNTDLETFEGFDGVIWREIGAAIDEDWGQIVAGAEQVMDWRLVSEGVDSFTDYGTLF